MVKRSLTFVLAVLMAMSVFCMSAAAEGTELVKILMHTEGVKITRTFEGPAITQEEMAQAIENSVDVIPEGAKVVPGRLEVYQQRGASCSTRPVFDISYKIWGTIGKPLCVFFRPADSEEWLLVSCRIGDVVEARFYSEGTYALAVAY